MNRKAKRLRADAQSIRENCARMLVHADNLERQAVALEEQEEAQREANAELVRVFLNYRERLRLAH